MTCMAYQCPQSGIPVGRIVRRVIVSKGMNQKEAAILAGGVAYEAAFSKGLAGLAPLDLWAVMMWPTPIVFKLLCKLIAAKLAQWETESMQERKIS